MPKIDNVAIRGIVASVPDTVARVDAVPGLSSEDSARLSRSTGIYERRVVNGGVTTSDLCTHAAKHLLNLLNWEPETVGAVILLTQTPDYQLPASAVVIQSQLDLPISAAAFDINLGCSAFPYGFAVVSSMMSTLGISRALLLVGDTISTVCNPNDRSTFPLFGDAGAAIALELDPCSNSSHVALGSDGKGCEAIIVRSGNLGSRNPVTKESFEEVSVGPGITRNSLQLTLSGTDVFAFAIKQVPIVINQVLEEANWKLEDVDHIVLHQANKKISDVIEKKLKYSPSVALSSLEKFGNTSSASIPITMVLHKEKFIGTKSVLFCGFGVGLSWAAMTTVLKDPVLELIEFRL
jgi:3-oxoacyl-[acyl-carrier-protein] synthase-3